MKVPIAWNTAVLTWEGLVDAAPLPVAVPDDVVYLDGGDVVEHLGRGLHDGLLVARGFRHLQHPRQQAVTHGTSLTSCSELITRPT